MKCFLPSHKATKAVTNINLKQCLLLNVLQCEQKFTRHAVGSLEGRKKHIY